MEVPTMNLVWGLEMDRAAKVWTRREKWVALFLALIVTAVAGLGKDGLVFLGLATASFATASAYVALRRSQVRAELLAQQSYALQAISFLNFRYPLQFGRWAILPDLAEVLVDLMVERKPKVILELGCGTSTVVLAYCRQVLALDCRIFSIESDERFASQTRARLDQHGVGDDVTIVVANLCEMKMAGRVCRWFDTDTWLENLLPVDLLLVDGPPGKLQKLSRYPALPLLYSKLSDRAVIILDDGRRTDERQIAARWSAEYPELKSFFLETLKGVWIWKGNKVDG